MQNFQGSDKERQDAIKKIWENQNKLLQTAQYYLKDGLEKNSVASKMVEASMWLRLYMEIENINPKVQVAIGTEEKQ